MNTSGASEDDGLVPANDRLGKYRLVAPLGRGGMADVYLAMLEGPGGFNKLVVLKELRQDSLEEGVGVEMFASEARVAARLNHPNIVQTLEVGSDGGRCFLAMEHLDGQSLQRVMRRCNERIAPIPLHAYLRIVVDVLSALEYAHSLKAFDGTPLGIVHRDVSPHNVILTYEGHVKLIDFGIAKTALASTETREGMIKGKVKYMPPEQATGQAIDARTDVFAVGMLLWEAVAGRNPWQGESDVTIFRALLSGAIPRLAANRGIDAGLASIVNRAVAADPRDRYPSAAAMRDDLESWLAARQGPPASLRDLSTLLCTLFETEREELRGLIDAWSRSPNGANEALQPFSFSRVRAGEAGTTQTPSLSKFATMPKAYVSPIPPRLDARPAGVGTPLKAALIVGGAAIFAAATTFAVVRSRSTPAPSGLNAAEAHPSTLNAAGSAPVLPSAPVVASSHVELRASPAWARLYVDDAPVSNPYEADLPRDGTTHTVRSEAPGYVGKTDSFKADVDHNLIFALSRLPPHGTAPRAAVDGISPIPRPGNVLEANAASSGEIRQPAAPPVDTGNPPAAKRKSRHEVDKEDPYAQ
jgi:serine/threonine protein kinase